MNKSDKHSELTFQLIVESAPSAMILVNNEGKIAFTNSQVEKLFGYKRNELIGQSMEILIPQRYREGHPDFRNMFFSSPQARAMGAGRELYALRKDGTEFPVEIGLNPLVTVEGTWVVAAIIDITERKKFEEQRMLFASIVNSSNDAILSKTLDGIIITWNHGAEKVFGYSSKEIIGKNISILIPSHLRHEENEIIEKIAKNESVEHYETERIRKDGKNIYVSLTISPIKDSLGNIIGASKICRDITEYKEAEAKLAASQKLYRRTLDNMLEGIQIHDFDWKYIYVNDTLVKYSHYTREELIGQSLMEKYQGIEQTELFKVLTRCMQERVSEHLETEFVFPNGSKADFELSIEPVPEGIFILSIDITRRKEAERKIVKANRLYNFLSNINQSIVHIDNKQELLNTACNIAVDTGGFRTAWIALLGEDGKLNMVSIRGEELVVKELNKFSGQDFSSPILKNTTPGKVLRTGKYDVKNDLQNDPEIKSLKEITIQHDLKSSISLPIKNDGKVIGVFGLQSIVKNFFDEQEINLLEEATGDISFALKNFEKEKLRKKMDDDLMINNVELKKINVELDRFVYSISHELRSPLTSVMGLFNIVKHDGENEENKEILNLINRSVFKMDETLREILDYSRNSRNKINFQKINLEKIIDDAFENSNYYQNGFSFDKQINIKADTLLFSDSTRIKIIVNNLISNALKYSKKKYGDSFIHINAIINDEKLFLEISDNGIGIKPEYLSEIYNMFYRATTISNGSGLGLYIAKECVEKLGGTIQVESEFEKGTKFKIEIPNNLPNKT